MPCTQMFMWSIHIVGMWFSYYHLHNWFDLSKKQGRHLQWWIIGCAMSHIAIEGLWRSHLVETVSQNRAEAHIKWGKLCHCQVNLDTLHSLSGLRNCGEPSKAWPRWSVPRECVLSGVGERALSVGEEGQSKKQSTTAWRGVMNTIR